MDLTKIDQPFGALDIETKVALCRAHFEGKAIEFRYSMGKFEACCSTPRFAEDVIYRLQPEPLRDISLPWAALDARWQWAARDKSGSVWVYVGYPERGASLWSAHPCYEVTDLFVNFDPGNKPWSESPIRRPEGL